MRYHRVILPHDKERAALMPLKRRRSMWATCCPIGASARALAGIEARDRPGCPRRHDGLWVSVAEETPITPVS